MGEVRVCVAVDAICMVLINVVRTAWFKERGGEILFAKMDGDEVGESWFGWTKVDQRQEMSGWSVDKDDNEGGQGWVGVANIRMPEEKERYMLKSLFTFLVRK